MSRRAVFLCLLATLARAADTDLAARYAEPAKLLTTSALADQHSLDRLEFLCDRIGNRLSGVCGARCRDRVGSSANEGCGAPKCPDPPRESALLGARLGIGCHA